MAGLVFRHLHRDAGSFQKIPSAEAGRRLSDQRCPARLRHRIQVEAGAVQPPARRQTGAPESRTRQRSLELKRDRRNSGSLNFDGCPSRTTTAPSEGMM